MLRQYPSNATDPAVGDVTLMASLSESSCQSRALTANSSADLFSAFAQGSGGAEQSAGLGGLALKCSVPAQAAQTLTIVFSWYFPHKNYHDTILGNYYSNIWRDSFDIATELSVPSKLVSVVEDINKFHAAFGHPNNPTPRWYLDLVINQFSHGQ